jgi:hypothetical protein
MRLRSSLAKTQNSTLPNGYSIFSNAPGLKRVSYRVELRKHTGLVTFITPPAGRGKLRALPARDAIQASHYNKAL